MMNQGSLVLDLSANGTWSGVVWPRRRSSSARRQEAGGTSPRGRAGPAQALPAETVGRSRDGGRPGRSSPMNMTSRAKCRDGSRSTPSPVPSILRLRPSPWRSTFGARSRQGARPVANEDHYLILRLGRCEETLMTSLSECLIRNASTSTGTGWSSPTGWAVTAKPPADSPSRRSSHLPDLLRQVAPQDRRTDRRRDHGPGITVLPGRRLDAAEGGLATTSTACRRR